MRTTHSGVHCVIGVLFFLVIRVCANDNFNKVFKQRGSIARCRASCMENFVVLPATRGYPIKFNYGGNGHTDGSDMGCTSETNWKCSMCWDYCESLAVFEQTRAQMCADDICLEGCQHACKFLYETSTSTSTAGPAREIASSSASPQEAPVMKLSEPRVTKTGVIMSWTISPASPAKLTYAVLGLNSFLDASGAAWEEIQQTTGHQVTLPKETKYEEILVAAFDSNGLVHKESKKLVFQLRAKRSLEQSLKYDNRTANLSAILIGLLIVISIVAVVAVLLRTFIASSRTKEVPVVWV